MGFIRYAMLLIFHSSSYIGFLDDLGLGVIGFGGREHVARQGLPLDTRGLQISLHMPMTAFFGDKLWDKNLAPVQMISTTTLDRTLERPKSNP